MEQSHQARRMKAFFWLGIGLVAVYFVLRTAAAPEFALTAWTVAACAFAFISPLCGLTVVAALGPFTEALTDDGRITALPFLLGVLGAALLFDVVRRRRLPQLNAALVAAGALFVVTLIGVLHTALSYGADRGLAAFEAWVPGIGGGLTVLFVAAWLGQHGEIRPLLVAVASSAAAALLSLTDYVTHGAAQSSVIGWLLRPGLDPFRMTGINAAPNAVATVFLVALAVAVGGAVFVARRDHRLAFIIAAGALVPAIVATFSRSALLALAVFVTLVGWRWRRWLGAVAATATIALGIVFASGNAIVRGVPSMFDETRLAAWRAGFDMWLAAPLAGQGFRAFEWLHAQYGSVADAPHNEWLRLLAEEGIFGAAAGAAFVIALLVLLLRQHDWLPFACGIAACGLFLMAQFNNPFIYVQVTAPAFLVIGTGLGLASVRVATPEPAPSAG